MAFHPAHSSAGLRSLADGAHPTVCRSPADRLLESSGLTVSSSGDSGLLCRFPGGGDILLFPFRHGNIHARETISGKKSSRRRGCSIHISGRLLSRQLVRIADSCPLSGLLFLYVHLYLPDHHRGRSSFFSFNRPGNRKPTETGLKSGGAGRGCCFCLSQYLSFLRDFPERTDPANHRRCREPEDRK